jgi:hypothetical protein
MQADMKNRNGRVYPMETLQKEVNRYDKSFIKEKRAFGELGHPDGPVVNLERVSHMITKLVPEGKNFIGEAKITDTPYGKIVKSLIDEGAKLGVSSRGMGSLENRAGAMHVKRDFYLATAADIVADPSAPDAFVFCTRYKVQGVMEGKEWIMDLGFGIMVLLKNKMFLKYKKILRELKNMNWLKEKLAHLISSLRNYNL